MRFCVSLQEINCNHLVKANTFIRFHFSLENVFCLLNLEGYEFKFQPIDFKLGANYLNHWLLTPALDDFPRLDLAPGLQ